MLSVAVLAILIIPAVLAGSKCPPRRDIYPCSCANIVHSRSRMTTIVTCNGLEDSDSLEVIFPYLRSIAIDQFYMYDSFWKAHALGEEGESKKVLPEDWLPLLRTKELHIEDSKLASCFACQGKLNCQNTHFTKFSVLNSSATDICTLCDTGRGDKYPWTGCMSKLKEFSFIHGKLTSLGAEFFPITMKELVSLNFSHNQIIRIDNNALKNLPKLVKLDLSHNAIASIEYIFRSQEFRLEFLDVSSNLIKTLGADIFSNLPKLKTFKANNNDITEMKQSQWANAPMTLNKVDLRDNPLHCDCSIRWVNSTKTSVDIKGACATPDSYQDTPIRRASRYLIERCTAAGVLGTRGPSTTAKPTTRRRTTYARQ